MNLLKLILLRKYKSVIDFEILKIEHVNSKDYVLTTLLLYLTESTDAENILNWFCKKFINVLVLFTSNAT